METALADRSLAELEAVIERGLTTFIEVGQALLAIRDGRKYTEQGYTAFDDYCREHWGWSRQRAHQYITASETVMALSTIVDTQPLNEGQARELAGLEPEAAATVLEEARSTAAKGKLTASHLRRTRERYQESEAYHETTPEPPDDEPIRDLDAGSESDEWQCSSCGEVWYDVAPDACPVCGGPVSQPEPMRWDDNDPPIPPSLDDEAPPTIAELKHLYNGVPKAVEPDAIISAAETSRELLQQAKEHLPDDGQAQLDLLYEFSKTVITVKQRLAQYPAAELVAAHAASGQRVHLTNFITGLRVWIQAVETELKPSLRLVRSE